ncbi:hypothetical protein [Streptomyces sedi]|uniref:hypothetical protein n=1 Tax=Streptomyces sedi TaxID=555059 RepID=UPI001B8788AD|nr:hypothetical protein [Streptomyces sedi]
MGAFGVVLVDELAKVARLDQFVARVVAADAWGGGEPVDDLEGAGSSSVGTGERAAAELGDDGGPAVLAHQAA